MAIVNGLTTTDSVKLHLGIASTDTTQDALIEDLITDSSAQIGAYLDRALSYTVYTNEPYPINGQQYLYLKQWPINVLASVTIEGILQTLNQDASYAANGIFLSGDDALIGRVYKPDGFMGSAYEHGFMRDTFAGMRSILVTYEAGYYLPADPLYVAGDPVSLPIAISLAATHAAVRHYNIIKRGLEGMASQREGGMSWAVQSDTSCGHGGLSPEVTSILNAYKRLAIA